MTTPDLTPSGGWKTIEKLPHPQDAGMFWAAIRTCGINSPMKWEVHAIALDDETHEVAANFYQGWNIDDYEFWQPCRVPTPPDAITTDTQDDREALRERIQTIMDEHIGASSWSGDAEVHGVPEAIDAILAALPLQENGNG